MTHAVGLSGDVKQGYRRRVQETEELIQFTRYNFAHVFKLECGHRLVRIGPEYMSNPGNYKCWECSSNVLPVPVFDLPQGAD